VTRRTDLVPADGGLRLLDNLDAARGEFARAGEADDVDIANMIVFEAVGQIHAIGGAGDIVRSMAAHAEDILGRRSPVSR
jgi:nitronate monooxygenase